MILDKSKNNWWQDAVFYQIYPKSFQDSNNDGIGDLRGIISRLDYLAKLGIDGIWLSPVYQSPQADNGYDISDYQAIDPVFGTMETMEELIVEAKKRGISIIMDLVLNHTSNEHKWFKEALKSRTNPYHDYYIWRDGDAYSFPNDMKAVFKGPAWTYVPELGRYYFHQFSKEQPDLNWENPSLRQELYQMIRFWKAKGVEGFRLDVIDQIAKDPDLQITANGPKLHTYLKELKREALGDEGLVTVGEAWSADVERAKLFSNPDNSELSMVFQFEHLTLDQQKGGEKWDLASLVLPEFKRCLANWQVGLFNCGWNSLFLNNHDLPRLVSRFGNDGPYRVMSAKMLATMLYGLQGTPFIYQGEELGMTNIDLPIEEYVDLEIHNMYRERLAKGFSVNEIMEAIRQRGRDNARTPMQWSTADHAGFSGAKPWLTVNPNYHFINAESACADSTSIFYYYQRLIKLRKQLTIFKNGQFKLLEAQHPQIFAYERHNDAESLLVVCNFSDQTQSFELPYQYHKAEILIGNYPENLDFKNYKQRFTNGDAQPELQPYEAQMLYLASPL